MNCRDFDQTWNQSLDARRRGEAVDDGGAARDRALREHAGSCPSCRVRHLRYEALRRALDAWAARPVPSPAPPAGLVDCILAAVARPEADRRRPARRRVAALALASAAAVVVAAIGLRSRPDPSPEAAPSASARKHLERGLLGAAVGDATAASWQLALLASGPAARLGREMIDVSTDAGADAEGGSPTAIDLPSIEAESFSPELIDRMGGLLTDGVRPLSTSARRAFGFLRPPTSENLERPVRPSTGKGA